VHDWKILHAVDEAIRWSAAVIIPNREAGTIIRALTQLWFRIFGPPNLIISDHEGAIDSEEASVWAERWGVHVKFKAPGAHAHVVERHHEILRRLIHRIEAQCKEEGLNVTPEDIVAEATFAKNALITIHGQTPYRALLGRSPNIMKEFEAAGNSMEADDQGGTPGVSRHVTRLREIAVRQMVEGTALDRIDRADKSKTRPAQIIKDIAVGDLIDIWRAPPNKDITGWRGPARVTNIGTGNEAAVTAEWQGRSFDVITGHLRRHLVLLALLGTGTLPLDIIRRATMQLIDACVTVSWVHGPKGWLLTKAAREHATIFHAILRVAECDLQLLGCIGGRFGRGMHNVSGMFNIDHSVILFWPEGKPLMSNTFELSGTQNLNMRHIFGENWHLMCWVQFLLVNLEQVEKIRSLDPGQPHLGGDVTGNEQPPKRDRTITTPAPLPLRPDIRMADNSRYDDGEEFQSARSRDTTPHTSRSRATSEPSTLNEQDIGCAASQRETIPELSSHEDMLAAAKTYDPNDPKNNHEVTEEEEAWNYLMDQESNVPSTESPALPPPCIEMQSHTDRILFGEKTLVEDSLEIEVDSEHAKLFRTMDMPNADEVLVFKVTKKGLQQAVIEKALDSLSKEEEAKYHNEVQAAKEKELQNWVDLKCVQQQWRKDATNIVDGKWVIKWKSVDHNKIVKARLTLRGFKDMQGQSVETFAGTTSRWGQRLICSVAALNKWPMFSADVSAAFLKGITFEELAKETGVVRDVSMELPNDAIGIFRKFKGFETFDQRHVLKMIRPVWGLNDAPRLWALKADRIMRAYTAVPGGTTGYTLKSDRKIYGWWSKGELVMLLSTHVDDFKGSCATKAVGEAFVAYMTKQFGTVKCTWNDFTHTGVRHSINKSGDITMDQYDYVKQLKTIDDTTVKNKPDDWPAEYALKVQFASLLGAVAWMVLTRMDIAVYVVALQRFTQAPQAIHIKRLNTLLRWVRRRPCAIVYKHFPPPYRVMVVTDSAFKNEDASALAMRGACIGISQKNNNNPGGGLHVLEYYARKQKRVVRSTLGAETRAMADGVDVGKVVAIALHEIHSGPLSYEDAREIELRGNQWKIPIEACIDARSLFDALKNEDTRTPTEVAMIFDLMALRESLECKRLDKLWWIDTRDMIADALTKGSIARDALMTISMESHWKLQHEPMQLSVAYKPLLI
jgi:hypothetical protein